MKVCKLIWINKYQYISISGNSLTNIGLQTDINSLSLCSSWPNLIEKPCWLLGDSNMQTSCHEVRLLTWAQHHTNSNSCSSSELLLYGLGMGQGELLYVAVCCVGILSITFHCEEIVITFISFGQRPLIYWTIILLRYIVVKYCCGLPTIQTQNKY